MAEGSEGVYEEEGDWIFKGSICGSNNLINSITERKEDNGEGSCEGGSNNLENGGSYPKCIDHNGIALLYYSSLTLLSIPFSS